MAVMPLVNISAIRGSRVLIFAHDAQILPLLRLAHSNLCLVMGVAQYKSVTTPLINFLASSGAREIVI